MVGLGTRIDSITNEMQRARRRLESTVSKRNATPQNKGQGWFTSVKEVVDQPLQKGGRPTLGIISKAEKSRVGTVQYQYQYYQAVVSITK